MRCLNTQHNDQSFRDCSLAGDKMFNTKTRIIQTQLRIINYDEKDINVMQAIKITHLLHTIKRTAYLCGVIYVE